MSERGRYLRSGSESRTAHSRGCLGRCVALSIRRAQTPAQEVMRVDQVTVVVGERTERK